MMRNAVRNQDILEAVATDDDGVKFQYFVETLGVPVDRKYYEAGEGTAAHIAAKYGNLGIVKYVLEKDPSIFKTKDDGGNTILFIAIANGHIDIVKYLMKIHRVNVHKRDERPNGNTPIHHAAEHGQLAILKYFMEEKHGEVDCTNNFKQPPVFLAVLNRHYPVIVYLAEERNADLGMIDHKNNNILYMAVNANDLSIIKYVLDKRQVLLDVNYKNIFGDTLLSRAALLGRYEIVKYLVSVKKVDVNIADDWGKTALHSAARGNHLRIANFLLEHGADPRARGEDGKLPLHEATNDKLTQFLENAATKPRERRSVPVQHQRTPPPVACTRMRDITEDRLQVGNRLAFSFGDVGSTFQLQSFFLIANIINAKMNGPPDHLQREKFASPRDKILQTKMDPIAVDAIKRLPPIKKTKERKL
jgi:ankyrin repeat protein